MRYVQLRRGVYFYRRRYPADLMATFGGSKFKVVSLRTHSPAEATKRAEKLAKEDDAEWESLRTNIDNLPNANPKDATRIATVKLVKLGIRPGEPLHEFDADQLHWAITDKHQSFMEEFRNEHGELPNPKDFLDPVDLEMLRIAKGRPAPKRLSDALEYYLKEHPKGRQKKFSADKHRSITHVLRVIGRDIPLTEYRRVHAESVRDDLIQSLKSRSVRRHLNDIGAVFQQGIRGFDLQIAQHPFRSMNIPGEGEDADSKATFSQAELEQVAKATRLANDSLRHMAAMLVNTGARMSEIVGLKCSDVVLTREAPHIVIQPHADAGRTLKTAGSRRKVPLVGVSLWAAEQALAKATKEPSGWLFPMYISRKGAAKLTVQSGSAGTAMNKWLKSATGTIKTSHCFRHTLRDRLRASGTPTEIQDVIGGWGARTIGQGYGDGHAPEQLHKYLAAIAI